MSFVFDSDLGEDEFQGENSWELGGKGASIFVIDASPNMFNLNENSGSEDELSSYFSKAIKCAHSTMCRKIISSDSDLGGVVIFNTDKAKNGMDFSSIYVLQDLAQPGAERVLELQQIINDRNGLATKKKYGSTNKASIHDVLWVCRNMFIKCKTKLSTKNILLFTCEDNPHINDKHRLKQALKGAKDLEEGRIFLEVLPLGDSFKMNSFYKELLLQVGDEESLPLSTLADPTQRFDDLLERVNRLQHKQRSSGKVSLILAPGVELGVKVFSSIRKSTKPSKLKLYKVTNEEVMTQRKEYLEDGELLMPSDYVKYQEYGGKRIKFTIDETKNMSKVYDTGIEIIGFKPFSVFTPDLYVKPANFIYPDEVSYKGSFKLFSCLLERCLTREICPIVRVVPRQNASVSWGFLVPQREEKDEKNVQFQPPGFQVCYLPFADDFRNIEIENRPRAESSQVDLAKEFMKKLHFRYNPEAFENPDLQTHWRNIEALALNSTGVEPITDYTVPDYDRIRRKAGALIEKWSSSVLPPSYDAQEVRKRKAPAQPRGPAPKKVKVDAAPLTVEEMAKQKKVDKMTVNALKEWLTTRGVKVTGKKKPQLVQDVYDELSLYDEF